MAGVLAFVGAPSSTSSGLATQSLRVHDDRQLRGGERLATAQAAVSSAAASGTGQPQLQGGLLAGGAFAAVAALGADRYRQRRGARGGRKEESLAVLKATATDTLAAPWETLKQDVESTDVGRQLLERQTHRAEGLLPHTDAKARYFGDSRETPRIVLYRDQAAWCPYCQKVWLLLEEKKVDYATVKVPMRSYGDKPQEFLQKLPSGLLPAIEIDGQLMTESLQIMFKVERLFRDPERPMFPDMDSPERARAEALLKLEREVFGAWCGYLFQPEIPFISGGEDGFTRALEVVDRELGNNTKSPFFLPYSYPTIVDMQYVSHMERAVASVMYYKGYDVRSKFPNIDRWLSAYEELPHYMASKSDYYTHCMDIPPQYGPCFENDSDSAKAARAAIDPGSARLPLQTDSKLEPFTAAQRGAAEADFRIEAAMQLIQNHEAVVKFCARAAGGDVGAWARGNPTKCQYADPYARPNMEVINTVDVALRVVAGALLRGDEEAVRKTWEAVTDEQPPPGGWHQVADCIAYLRDRIGSPRDLSMPAAKFLRAYLGEAVVSLQA
eukprot:TRINITY_DN39849_c0_g1_i1.p1 TRINITY_DN39849_c0_g1~~TRINITY_DN39849_c0_g1_i1.p1  ORF type:complete len:555 (+),score=152.08 TRINITY_DN39849_c0_g1_i1:84-1748(+)